MRASRGLGFAVVLLALAGGLRCAYAPNPKSGTLMCSVATHECPEGYTCDGDFCIKDGQQDAGAVGSAGQTGTSGAGGKAGAGGGGTAGAGGMGGAISGTAGVGVIPCSGTCTIKIEGTLTKTPPSTATTNPDKFVGHWVYDAGSKETVTCTDGSSNEMSLATDYVEVELGAPLTATYFCPWNVTVPAGSTVIRVGQSCSRNMTNATTGTTKFTWHGTTFTLTPKTPDDNTASLSAMITVDYVDDASKTGCTPP